ncbi:lamin tail domain-containing protein [Candidatus Roizmanbacteria bacterium]|nr:lamin tail domain-containing protein [Candidatus Roizmanbacteria bacterium]
MRKIYVFLLFAFFFILLYPVFGEQKVKINEFAIDLSPQQVELINTSSDSADISNWYLDDSGGTTYYSIPQNTYLYPHACLVFSSDFNLNKSSPDTLRLYDATSPPTATNASLIDSYAYKSSPGTGKSYFRNPDGENNWTTGTSTLGLYNLSGQSCIITPTLTPSPNPTPTIIPSTTPSLTPTSPPLTVTPSVNPTPASYENIFISEVMVYPDTGQSEWIELYNGNDFSVPLNNWYIDDVESGGATPKQFSQQISAKGYATITFSSSLFNNDQDSVRLLDFNKIQKDGFEYQNPLQGKSLGRVSFDSESFCEEEPSYGVVNTSCISPTVTIKTSQSSSVSSTPKSKEIKKQDIQKTDNSFQTFSSAPAAYVVNKPRIAAPNVLGATTIEKNIKTQTKSPKSLINHLSFLSFSYSILTIVSVLIRMKNAV